MLCYVDAGHGHWIIHPNGASPTIGPRPNGLLIGIDSDYVYEQASMQLAPGDRIIFISDGVGERASPEGELFGNQRAADVLAKTDTPFEDVSSLFAAVSDFAGGAGIADDT